MKCRLVGILTLTGAAFLLGGCGKSEAPAASTAAAETRAGGAREIAITANDQMKYSITEIRVQPGEKLSVTLTNLGQMPKAAMAHNWVLLVPMSDADATSFAMSCASRAPDYLPEDKSKILAHTKLLGGHDSDTVELTAPTAPGEYPFLCTFPGHAALMRGKLIVGPGKP